jgi:hypothetical protein
MKLKIMVTVLCGGMLVAGCSTVPNDPVVVKSASPRGKIKITVEPDRSVQITNVSVSQYNDELKVTGILRPKSMMVRTAGHIHVGFLDLDGTAIRQLKVEPTSNVFFRRSIIKPRLRVSVALAVAEVSEVRLKHHDAPIDVCSYGVGAGSRSGGSNEG